MNTKEKEKGVISNVEISFDWIPLDITIQILLKLPAKSLLNFKRVSKTWCSIIRSQIFIDAFMSMSISRPRLLLALKHNHNKDNQLVFFSSPLFSQESDDSSSIVSRHEMTISKPSPSDYVIHGTPVRGFICFSRNEQHMVCNPTTRQVINLPADHRFDHGTVKSYMLLGYDPSNDKYKVLRLVTQPSCKLISENLVYTLERQQSSDFPWRRIESDIPTYLPWSNSVYINGVVYYDAIQPCIRSMIVVAFDFGSERFGQIKTPEKPLCCLANYKGKLACLSILNENSYSLWVLNDVKEKIWSKTDTFVIPDFGIPDTSVPHFLWKPQLTFLGTTNAGKLVFKPLVDGLDVIYFDIKEKSIRKVKLEELTNDEEFICRKHIRYVSICDHVENIISIPI